MKKMLIALLLFTLLLLLVLMSACSHQRTDDCTLRIVCTSFSEYDWTRNILGERIADVELSLLTDNGADMHSYQATADDIIKVSECDLLITVGGESDKWLDDALKNSRNQNQRVIRLLDLVAACDDSCETEHEHEHEHEGQDEHIWLSLKNAMLLCAEIANALSQLDLDNSALYEENAAAYIAKLEALDARYEATASAASKKVLLFADRFPFTYMAEDYGLTCIAAFSGCTADSEASASTVKRLASAIDTHGLTSVLVLEKSSTDIARTVILQTESKNQHILTLNSIQSVTRGEIERGANYLQMMEKNLSVIAEALEG